MPTDNAALSGTGQTERALFEVLSQACSREKEACRDPETSAWHLMRQPGERTTTLFDSGLISAYATGIRTLASLGLVTITEDNGGRHVVAEITDAGRALEAELIASWTA